MKKIYKVTLTAEERSELTQLVSTGKSSAAKIKDSACRVYARLDSRLRGNDGVFTNLLTDGSINLPTTAVVAEF